MSNYEIVKKLIKEGAYNVSTRECEDYRLNSSGGDYTEWDSLVYEDLRFFIYHDGTSCDWHERCPVCGCYDCNSHSYEDYKYLCEVTREELLQYVRSL